MRAKVEVDLNAVSLLLAVVETGSFSAAARKLGLPVSSVSRRVASLEKTLGVALVVRTTRSLRLTDPGASYVARASRALRDLDAIHDDLRRLQSEPKGRVRITVPVSMGAAMSVVAAPLLARHPELALEVDLHDARPDPLEQGFDIAVRVGKPVESTWVARKLGVSSHQLFASPNYLRRAPRLSGLENLHEHRCLSSTTLDGFATWELFEGRRRVRHRFEPVLQFNEAMALKRAVVEGIGVAMLESCSCHAELASGELVAVLPELRGPEGGVWLQFARRGQSTAATSLVVDHCLTVLPALIHPPSCDAAARAAKR